MLKARYVIALLLLVFALPVVSQVRSDSVLSRESDEAARTREERESARNILLSAAQEASNSDPAKAAGFLNRAARLQFRLNSSQEAIATYESALALLKDFPTSTIRIDSLNGIAKILVNSGDCDRAQTHIDQARSLSEAQNYEAGRGEALLALSECQSFDDVSKASQTIADSIRFFASARDKKGIARAHMLKGDFEIMRNDLVEATKSNEVAITIWRELGLPDEEAGALINIGFIHHRKAAWQECLTYLTQAKALLDEESESTRMGQIYAGIAEAFMESGIPEAGLTNALKSLDSFRLADDAQGMVAAKWDIGKAYYLQGNYPEAIKWLEEARNDAREKKYPRIAAFCTDFLGRTHLASGAPDRALEYLRSALASYIDLQSPREISRTKVLIGRIYEDQGRTVEARRLLLEGASELERLFDRSNEAVAFFALGQLEMGVKDLDRAEEYFRRSIEVTEEMRGATTSGDLTTAMSATVSDRYDSYVDCLMRQHAQQPEAGHAVRAFETSELARARTLATWLRSKQSGLAALDPELAAQEKAIVQLLRVKENVRIDILKKSDDQNALSAVEAELSQLEAQYQQIQQTIRTRFPAYQQMMQPDAVTLREIQTKVLGDQQSLLLEYSLGDERSYLWLVSHNEFQSYELPGRREIEDAARTLYTSLTALQPRPGEAFADHQARTRKAEESLPGEISQLSKLVLTPVADKLGKQRLIIVPDGALQYIPFQALTLPASQPSEAEPLIVNHEIVNQPSAATLALLLNDSTERTQAKGSVAILADPVFEADDARLLDRNVAAAPRKMGTSETDEVSRVFRDVGQSVDNRRIPRLLASRQEAEAIMAVVPGKTAFKALDFEANRSTLSTAGIGQHRILHLATHTMIDNANPELSGILLSLVDSQGKPLDGFLSMSDIYELKLSSNLVVLSACNTALGKDVRGEGLVGLTRGFLYAGASGVTASLWKVDDEATAALMSRFYEGIFKRGLTPAAALREAQIATRNEKRWRSPFFWAGFVIQGRYNQTETLEASWTSQSTQKIVFGSIIGLLSLAALLFVIRRRLRIRHS